jgi:dicarboxylate/amino acid:cation (Na+ or H+) symporter, DAACS family
VSAIAIWLRRGASSLPLQTVFGLLLGAFVGLKWPEFAKLLNPLGLLFIQAIKMVVIPLVFSSVTLGAYRMGSDMRQLGRVAGVAGLWFLIATVVSIIVALAIHQLVHPGVGVGLVATGSIPPNLATSIDWAHYLLDLVPSNIVAAMANQKILPTLIFAIMFGIALAGVGPGAERVVGFMEAMLSAVFRMTGWITALTPVAVFGIMSWVFASQGTGVLVGLLKLVGTMYFGLLILVVIFCLVMLAIGHNPLHVTRKVMEPVALAFVSRSSEVAFPAHMKSLEQLGVPNSVSAVVLPLGYSFNLDGSAMYIALATTFLADAYGLHLTPAALWTVLVTTIIASKGIANVPSGSLVAMATVLTAIGMPVEAIAIIAGVDVFMDMGRTAINLFGNTAAVLLVNKVSMNDAGNIKVATNVR